MDKLKLILLALAFTGFVTLGIHNVIHTDNSLKLKDIQLKSATANLTQLQLKYDILNKNLEIELNAKDHNQQKIDDLQKQKDELQKQLQDAQSQLQARAATKAAAAQKLQQTASLSATAYAAGANPYRDYIFAHEGAIDSVNSIGCIGLGQDCNGQLAVDCPDWRTDLNCQLAFWDRYAVTRYGSWPNAYAFKIANGWW